MDCASKGIVSGYAEGDFRPTATVTRAHFTVMLSRAFYPAETEANASMKEFGWFVPNAVALDEAGILKNTAFQSGYTATTTMNQPISRYDMAQLMTNIMSAKGFSATNAQKSLAAYEITDYRSIPAKYQDAVKNVFALGIITGYADGKFGGSGNMTRGAGATVIYRMMKYTPDTKVPDVETPAGPEPDITKPETPEKPNTPPAGNSVITVSSTRDANGNTAWSSSNGNYPDGYLNNGDPITQENVLKLLNAAKTQWYDGMSWNGTKKNTNCYDYINTHKSTLSTYALCGLKASANGTDARLDVRYGCGGFACMISDYVFGTTSNQLRTLNDPKDVRPGDIVISSNTKGIVGHVFIATGTMEYINGIPALRNSYEGNMSGQVRWYANEGAIRLDLGTITVYTRYPD